MRYPPQKLNLRARIVLVIALAMLPVVVLFVYRSVQQYNDDYRTAGANLVRLSQVAASNQNAVVQGVHDMLLGISSAPFVERRNWPVCDTYLSVINRRYPYYHTFSLYDENGDITCGSNGGGRQINVSDRPYFKQAKEEKRFIAGGYLVNRISGEPVAAFALPLFRNSEFSGLVTTSLRLDAFAALIHQIRWPDGASVMIADSKGIVLAGNDMAADIPGRPVHPAALRAQFAPDGPRLTEVPDADGHTHLYAISPVVHDGRPVLYVILGLEKTAVLAPAVQSLAVGLLALALIFVLTVTAAWSAGKRLLIAPVGRLIAAAKRVTQGDYQARSGIDHGAGELGQLGYYFDEMTGALEKREREQRAATEYIEYMAFHDQLTRLPNRRYLQKVLPECLVKARADDAQVAVLFVNLNRFRVISHSLGHFAGDRILCAVADRLRACLRAEWIAARFGGDEFICVLARIGGAGDAADAAQGILRALAAPYAIGAETVNLSASIGISLFPGDGEDAETLVKYAEVAMRNAKKSPVHVQQFVREMSVSAIRRLSLENDLRRALALGQFALYYQPQLSLADGRLIGAEALIRWIHPEKGMISPLQFIALAEETELITEVGAWIIRAACEQNQAWHRAGLWTCQVAVNVSATQFKSPRFVDVVRTALEESGHPPSLLELEVTEGTLLSGATDILADLRALGVSLSIDDFGTGYSSLSYLKDLPVNKLKIDQSFIKDIATVPDNQAITRAIITVAKDLDLTVLAEGVETEDACLLLKDIQCDAVQGYYVSVPLPADEFGALLRRAGAARTAQV